MNYRSVAKNYVVALLAQGVSTCASMATGFLVPKVLGVAEFGYYQLFVFYATYVGLCHLGLTDGVYLIMGGKSRSELDSSSVKSQLVVGLAYESLFAVALVFAAILGGMERERSLVLLVLAFYLIVKNLGAYLGYVLQAVNETRLFSISTIVEKGLFVLLVVLLLALGVDSFAPYALAFSLGSFAQMVYCAVYTREIGGAAEILLILVPAEIRIMLRDVVEPALAPEECAEEAEVPGYLHVRGVAPGGEDLDEAGDRVGLVGIAAHGP